MIFLTLVIIGAWMIGYAMGRQSRRPLPPPTRHPLDRWQDVPYELWTGRWRRERP